MPLGSLDAYLGRIGLSGSPRPSLAEVHRAHAGAIAFENFDPYSGRPVSLDPADLEDKIVSRGRGGYCFEHNLLLRAAIESLSLDASSDTEVTPMLARVRAGPEGSPRPLNHLLLRVTDPRGTWLADVGFGAACPLEPLPFELGTETDQSGWRYRLVHDTAGPEWVLQLFQDGGWADLYGFVPEAVEEIDIEVQNWFTATHPTSSFVSGLLTGRRSAERCVSLFVFDEAILVERPVGGASSITEVAREDVPRILSDRLGIAGVSLGQDGRFVLAEEAEEPPRSSA